MVTSVNPCCMLMPPGDVLYQLREDGAPSSPVQRTLRRWLLAEPYIHRATAMFALGASAYLV